MRTHLTMRQLLKSHRQMLKSIRKGVELRLLVCKIPTLYA